jgi:hypothetical protein
VTLSLEWGTYASPHSNCEASLRARDRADVMGNFRRFPVSWLMEEEEDCFRFKTRTASRSAASSIAQTFMRGAISMQGITCRAMRRGGLRSQFPGCRSCLSGLNTFLPTSMALVNLFSVDCARKHLDLQR